MAVALCMILSARAASQIASSEEAPATDDSSRRILGIIPNYRTSATLTGYMPLSPGTKFHLAKEDAFDRGTFVLAGLFAAQSQWTQATPSFGHGVGAYGRYYAGALGDLVVGDFMTEAVYPRVLRQDPRYFRRGAGSAWGRLGYAIGQDRVDAHRCRQRMVQRVRDPWQRDGCRDRGCLLSGRPHVLTRRIALELADRHGRRRECPEGILAGPRSEIRPPCRWAGSRKVAAAGYAPNWRR
jgi:hypothetical protein